VILSNLVPNNDSNFAKNLILIMSFFDTAVEMVRNETIKILGKPKWKEAVKSQEHQGLQESCHPTAIHVCSYHTLTSCHRGRHAPYEKIYIGWKISLAFGQCV